MKQQIFTNVDYRYIKSNTRDFLCLTEDEYNIFKITKDEKLKENLLNKHLRIKEKIKKEEGFDNFCYDFKSKQIIDLSDEGFEKPFDFYNNLGTKQHKLNDLIFSLSNDYEDLLK